MTDDPLATLTRALDQTGALIAGVRPDQADLPTPCRSWDVRALVNHIVDETTQFALLTAGGTRKQLAEDLIGDDWAAAYREAADALLDAWRQPGVVDRPQQAPWGEVSAAFVRGQQLTELTTHA